MGPENIHMRNIIHTKLGVFSNVYAYINIYALLCTYMHAISMRNKTKNLKENNQGYREGFGR